MRTLIDSGYVDAVAALPGFRVLERYASFALVDGPTRPSVVPESACELLSDTAISVHGRDVEIPEGVFELGDAPHTLVRFAGPIATPWRTQLARVGAEILFWAPPHGACLRLPDGLDADALRAKFPFIVGAQPYVEEQCRRGIAAPNATVRRDTGALPGVWDLVCFSREGRVRVEDELRRLGIEVLASSSSKIRVRYSGDAAVLRDIVGVKLAGEARAPKLTAPTPGPIPGLSTELANTLGLPVADETWPARVGGKGQVVAVADTGLDRGTLAPNVLHADFAGRVKHLVSWPINESWDGFVDNPRGDDGGADIGSGHGTYIAGLVLGAGAQSNGQHRGMAPQAELVFQAIEQNTRVQAQHAAQLSSGYQLSGRPLDLRQLFQQARDFGARIHVNAWGDPASAGYTDDCFEVDLFLREHQDAVVVFAAGNDATDRDANRVLDSGSLFAPASAKNVIAVGATEGPLAGIGLRRTWGELDPTGQRFRAGADRIDPISGEPGRIALFSCTGPTRDGRIKPDVCAPGTNLVAARSQATGGHGWGLASPMPHYMYDGGTSAATGVTGGFIAVLRQAWSDARGGVAPSGAALKALTVLGAQPVLSRIDGREEGRFVAGFGRLDFARSAPTRADGQVRLIDERDPGLLTGELREFEIVHVAVAPFRAVLAWYDAPGERLVNDLDLALVDAAGLVTWGNHPSGTRGTPDRTNNVERIDIATLAAGTYKLRVIARNVPDGPQNFALAFSAPRAALPDLPVEWISGVGARTAEKLNAAGFANLRELRDVAPAQIAQALGSSKAASDKLRAKLGLIFQVLAQPLAPAIPRTLTLAQATASNPASGIDVATWESARTQLLPLTLVFDKRRLDDVVLQRLFV